ncbi:hypothetical protein Barb7_00856 [Bacteroidales bacterium Barb7]|nr:hypothetical protein Barb7_00856 [Bacteroidales bacterium Barb7]
MTHIKKVSMMRNSNNILKQKLLRLANLHIICRWTKRLILAVVVVTLGVAVVNSGIGIFLAFVIGFLLLRFLIRLAFRLLIMLVYVVLIVLIISLIIL